MSDQNETGEWTDPSHVENFINFSDKANDLEAYKGALKLFLGTFDQVAVGILHVQADQQISFHNQCARRILGYSAEKLSQLSFYDLVYMEDLGKIQERQLLLLAGSIERYAYECRLRQQDGRYIWTHVTVALQHSPDMHWPHSIVTIIDISERKKAEEKYQRAKQELHINLAQLEAMITHLPQALLIFNRDGELRRANPAAEALHAQRMLTPPSDEETHFLRLRDAQGKDIEAGQWPLEKALRGEEVVDFMAELVEGEAKDKNSAAETSSWHCFNAVPVFSRSGQLIAIIMTIHDITVMKKIEIALRESELGYRQLADSMPHIVWISNALGEPTFFNKRWYEFAGHILGSEGGQPRWETLIHPDDMPLIRERYWWGIQNGQAFEAQIRLKNRLTATYEWHLVKAVPARSEQGQIMRWYGTSTDIQHQKMVEERLRRADKAKDEFFAVLSHELRSPLNVILGYTDLLKRRETVPISINEAIDAIERNAHTQTQLVGDLLEISKIIGGKMPFQRRRFDPGDMIKDAYESVRFAAAAKRIDLKMEVDPGVQELDADPNRMRQILWNLLSNAIKFTPEEGRVSLAAKGMGEWYEIRIKDTGIGLPPEALSHIFDRFWQEDALESPRQFGLGLGLSIVRHLTEMHGGRVWAESQGRGQGSEFVIQLPLRGVQVLPVLAPSPWQIKEALSREADLDRGSERPKKPNGEDKEKSAYKAKAALLQEGQELEGRCILVVDDQEDSARLIERILSDVGAEVYRASSGVEALAMFKTQKFDLVLSDIAMPEMDGLDLMREIRAREHAAAREPTPAIAFATYAGELSQLQAAEAGFQRYLTKPVSLRVLIHEVISVLNESAGLPPPGGSWLQPSTTAEGSIS